VPLILTPDERARVKYHLGYGLVNSAASLQFGLSRPIQTLFLVEQAMTNLIDEAIPKVRQIIGILEEVECRLVSAQTRLAAESLGEIRMREKEPDLLEDEYFRWGGRLADLLMVPFYAYSNRYRGRGPSRGGNVPVSG